MRRFVGPLIARPLAIVACILMLGGCSGDESLDPGVLPDVTLTELQGDAQVDVGELTGPVVVPLFASWCGPCRKELPIFEQFSEQYGDQVQVLGINWTDPQEGKAIDLVSETGVTFDVLADPMGETGEPPNQRIPGLPTLWLVDEDGDITFREAIKIDTLDELVALVEEHLGVTL